MRKFIVALAAALALIATDASAQNVLRRGNVAEPDTLDPQKYGLSYETEIMRDLFIGLTGLDAKGDVIPGAAESWTISPDGMTYTFKMRAGHVWSDGTKVTAEDAVFGIRRALDPKTNAQYANLAYKIVNAPDVNSGTLPPEALGVKALDENTLEIRLSRPSPILIDLLATPILFPVPKHAVERYGEDWVKPGNMVSNGPFTLTEWVPNDHVLVTKNLKFYDAANVAPDEVIYYPTDNDEAALKRFRAGELDFNARYSPRQHEWLKANMPREAHSAMSSWVTYIVLNLDNPKFADVRVRRALAMAVDRETITDRVLKTGESPAYGFVPPVIKGYAGAEFDFRNMLLPERQAQARQLLLDAGYGPDNPLTFNFNYRTGEANRKIAVALADMWKSVGVTANLAADEVKVHYNSLREHDFEVADAGWSSPTDPEYFIYLLRTESTETNYGNYSNTEYDRIAFEAETIMDKPTRYARYAEAEAIALADAPIIPILFNVSRNLVQPYLKGYEDNPQDVHPSRWMRLEQHGE